MTTDHSTIIAFVFSKSEISSEIYEGIHRLHNDGSIEILDVCEFDVKDNGKIRFERAMVLPLIGASDGIFLEAFVGLLFFNAPHNDNVEKAISDIKLDQNFIHSLHAKAVPGASVLFVHVKGLPETATFQTIARNADQALSITLSHEQEAKLEVLFHGKQLSDPQYTDVQMH